MTEAFAAITADGPNHQYVAADDGEAPILAAMVTISITPTAASAHGLDLTCFKSGANEVCYGPQGYVSIEQELNDGRYVIGHDNRGHAWRALVFGGPHDQRIMRGPR